MSSVLRRDARPNILYILSDQHSVDVLGCYDKKVSVTPNLDALAESGAIFDNMYCPAPICVASRMALLSGLHPHEIETWTNRDSMNCGIPTFVHALGAAGYSTTLVGRLHSLGPDQLRGYERRLVGDHQSNYGRIDAGSRGVLEGTAGPDYVSLERSGSGLSPYLVHDEDVTAATVGYLRYLGGRKREGLRVEPFFVSVGYMLPHPPYVSTRSDIEVCRGSVVPPRLREPYGDGLHPYIKWWRSFTRVENVPMELVMRARTGYWGLVYRLDTMIGEVLDALRDNHLDDNTMIVYTSDHGDHLGEHDLWWKHTFYESSVRVPGIVAWKGELDGSRRCQEVVSGLDLTASIISAAGAPGLPGSSGRDLLPLLKAKGRDWENVAYSEYCSDEEFAPLGGTRQRMIRRGDWKYVYYDGFPPQLFNLGEDPGEMVDRGADRSLGRLMDDLRHLVLEGWSPERIATRMELNRERAQVIGSWSGATHPDDRYWWRMTAEMNRLGGDGNARH